MGTEQKLLDAEYADDTALYTSFSIDMMDLQRSALRTFCLASGARINQNKSYGILVGTGEIYTWG